MVGTLLGFLTLALTAAAGLGGFVFAKRFTRTRLRFVDAVHSPFFPAVAGMAAFLVAWPFAALPIVSMGTASIFAIGTALGSLSGARTLGRSEHARGRLRP